MLSIRMLTTVALGYVLVLSKPFQINADYTVKADAATTLANVFGDREDIADLLFTTTDAVTLNGSTSSLPALGFTIARYNIGRSTNNVVDDSGTEVSMKTSDKLPAFKFMEAFWLDWMSKDPTSTSWNWDGDAKQRKMVSLATQRDVDILEAFSNSPPWWMTNNHATAGGDDGDKGNLGDWNHNQFALYLATVVSHARTSWRINFTYIEAFNEPMSTWWEYPGGQEGCHFDVDAQKDILVKLRLQLAIIGLQDMAISSSDENSPSLALSTLTSISSDSDAMAAIGKVNTHGYDG